MPTQSPNKLLRLYNNKAYTKLVFIDSDLETKIQWQTQETIKFA